MSQIKTIGLNAATKRNLDTYIALQAHPPAITTVVQFAIEALVEGRIMPRSEVCSCDKSTPIRHNNADICSHCQLLIVERKVPK